MIKNASGGTSPPNNVDDSPLDAATAFAFFAAIFFSVITLEKNQ